MDVIQNKVNGIGSFYLHAYTHRDMHTPIYAKCNMSLGYV